MRFSVLSVLLLGCGDTAKTPEITNNPEPDVTINIDKETSTRSSTIEEIVQIDLECAAPVATVTDNGHVFYDLDDLVEPLGCEGGNFALGFSFDYTEVSFSCNPPDDAFLWWRCDLPLPENMQGYHFLFFDPISDPYHPTDPVLVDMRSIPLVEECAGQDVGLVFWATKEGANTLCDDEENIARGFGQIEFPNQSGHIYLDALGDEPILVNSPWKGLVEL